MKGILFMGTPEIAATSLSALIETGYPILGVVTREDKPKGRGKVLTAPPVKELALAKGIPVYQPKTLRDDAFAALLAEINPDLIIVVAYGKILPKNVLDYPKYGCVNLHVSLLPKYRGAAPMQRAIMAGESETGVTVMYMDEGLDTGDIIAREAFPIGPTDDFEVVHDTSAAIGARLLVSTIKTIYDGTATRTPQDNAGATYAEKIEKADCLIDFTKSAKVLDCFIRGVTPIPMAYCMHAGAMLKICRATPEMGRSGAPGEVLEVSGVGDGYILVACGEGALRVSAVIPEGKGRMSAGDFVRGRKIQKGDVLNP